MKKNILSLAALLIASATFVACSSDDNIIDENQQPANPTGKYTMTINASKGGDGATTRALTLDGKTLKVKWAATDQVSVFPASSNSTLLGTLTAAASETGTTTLSGDLTGKVNVGDNLNLLFPRGEWDYTGQKGILLSDENSIEKKYDYAQANVTVAAIDDSKITTTADANFASQQAIVKFTLKNKANGNAIDASKLTISAASNKLVTKKTLVGIGDKLYHTGYTVDGGSGGFNDGESHTKLVDGDLSTKWCANSGPWYIEFHTASAIKVDGYMFRTGDDTGSYSGRNPKSWVLKGKVNSEDEWITIDEKTDNTEMPAANNTEHDFTATITGTYKYFRLDITANQSGDIMQLSEMKLFSTATEPTEFTDYGPITVTPASATSEFTVALRNENAGADTYTITASVDGESFTLEKSGVTFVNGKYYEIAASLTEQTTIDLSTLTEDKTVKNGYTLTGTLNKGVKISIADGATVTLDGVTIEGIGSDWYPYAGITCKGDATIILKDGTTNSVKGYEGYYPGIQGAEDKTLTITGNGSLNASSNGSTPGIGSGYGSGRPCGNIIIEGGTITATGGSSAAGIGSGQYSSCGNITIRSTVTHVTATKGSGASNSIGAGNNGTCGTVTIEDSSKVTQN